MPSYQHYVIGHNVTKTANGFQLDSTYYKRYYSMIDAEIYFGDTYIEEAHDIAWQVQQQQQPLFGYNSYIFDEIALGNRIITGQFNVNFTGPNVFEKIIESAKNASAFPTAYTVTNKEKEGAPSEHKNSLTKHDKPDHDSIWKPLFDIDIVCQNDTKGAAPAHIVLQDANISMSAGQISAQGGVFQQAYRFVARDLLLVE